MHDILNLSISDNQTPFRYWFSPFMWSEFQEKVEFILLLASWLPMGRSDENKFQRLPIFVYVIVSASTDGSSPACVDNPPPDK